MSQDDPLYSELCLIAARLLPERAAVWIEKGLAANPTDSIIELGLLQMGSSINTINDTLKSEYTERFIALSQNNPENAAQSLLARVLSSRSVASLKTTFNP